MDLWFLRARAGLKVQENALAFFVNEYLLGGNARLGHLAHDGVHVVVQDELARAKVVLVNELQHLEVRQQKQRVDGLRDARNESRHKQPRAAQSLAKITRLDHHFVKGVVQRVARLLRGRAEEFYCVGEKNYCK